MRQKAVKATCCKTPGGARLGGEGTSTRIWFGCTAYSALSNPLYDLGKTPRLSSTGEEEKRSSDERKNTQRKRTGVLQWRLQIDEGGTCGLSVGYCEGSVISGRERCIIIQKVKPAEKS